MSDSVIRFDRLTTHFRVKNLKKLRTEPSLAVSRNIRPPQNNSSAVGRPTVETVPEPDSSG